MFPRLSLIGGVAVAGHFSFANRSLFGQLEMVRVAFILPLKRVINAEKPQPSASCRKLSLAYNWIIVILHKRACSQGELAVKELFMRT